MPSPVIMPIAEVCDRLTIAVLKLERLGSDQIDLDLLSRQIVYYRKGLDYSKPEMVKLVAELHTINGLMWDAEHEIRKGLDDNLGLEEIGRRALLIRDLNRKRIKIKNDITVLCNQPEFVDCKMNHASSD